MGSSYCSTVEEEPGALWRFLMLEEDAIVHTIYFEISEKRVFAKWKQERIIDSRRSEWNSDCVYIDGFENLISKKEKIK